MSFARNENATHLPSAFGDRDYQSLSVKCLYLVTFRQFRMQGKQKLLKEASCLIRTLKRSFTTKFTDPAAQGAETIVQREITMFLQASATVTQRVKYQIQRNTSHAPNAKATSNN
jgi:hypothetical protein